LFLLSSFYVSSPLIASLDTEANEQLGMAATTAWICFWQYDLPELGKKNGMMNIIFLPYI